MSPVTPIPRLRNTSGQICKLACHAGCSRMTQHRPILSTLLWIAYFQPGNKVTDARSHERNRDRGLVMFAGPLLGLGIAAVSFASALSSAAEPQVASGPVRGVIRSIQQATISTDAPLRAIGLPFREGDRFQRGDLLAEFDCQRQRSDLEAALAVQREAALMLETNIQLDRHKAIGRNDVEIARARQQKAHAEAQGLKTRTDDCRLVAPFGGRVVELAIRLHERTVPQRAFITILDDSRLEIELIAPSAMLADVQPGTPFAFQIDELGGRRIAAEVGSISAAVDPVSKTVKLIGAIKGEVQNVLSGMSGTAWFGPNMTVDAP